MFDNCDAYDMVTNALGIGNESLDFTTYDGSFPSLDVASFSVELSASSGLQGVMGSYLKTDSIGETLVIDFEEEVRSVGGFFFLVDEFQLPVIGILELELSDGTSYVTSLTKDGGFAGFIRESHPSWFRPLHVCRPRGLFAQTWCCPFTSWSCVAGHRQARRRRRSV